MRLVHNVNNLLHDHSLIDTLVEVRGWVKSKRDSKSGISFITISDGSCFSALQIIAQRTLSNYNEIICLTKDCAITATGTLVMSRGSGQSVELLADRIDIIGLVANPDTYPVSLKHHSLEHLRSVPHLRIRTNLIAAITRIKNLVSFGIHDYFQRHGFIWVHTPIITTADCEGAGELFNVTTTASDATDFFGRPAYLTVSGQLNAESYCLAMSKVYTFGPTFRAEHSHTTRHLSEFWMVEPEVAFADLHDIAGLASSLLQHLFQLVLDRAQDDMQFLSKIAECDLIQRLSDVITNDFTIISYTDAINQLLPHNDSFEYSLKWGDDLATEHERYLCEIIFKKPVIVINYPKDIKAFYMRLNDDNQTVAALDILVPGVGEIIGGSQREERYEYLVRAMQHKNINDLPWYLDLRRFGSAPHAGFGLGLERLISYITGVANVRDVVPFPRVPNDAPC